MIDGCNACKERTSEVFKQLEKAELDAIGYNACKERTGKVSQQLDRAKLNTFGYNAMLLKVLTEAGDRINGFFKIKARDGTKDDA